MIIPVIKKNEKIKSLNTMRIEVKNTYGSFMYQKAGGNCKLCYIDDIVQSTNNYHDLNNFVDRLNELFKVNKRLCFQINVNSEDFVKKLNKHFRLIFCNKVPIGYKHNAKGYTYIALFLTNNNFYSNDVNHEVVLDRMKTYKKEIESFNLKCSFK